ncbi:MAG: response regulator [Krumholzibacteria bacterium]|nr:response regulator [Candidatus Krumholzibacteria bacterium]
MTPARRDPEPTTAKLQARVHELEARLADLERHAAGARYRELFERSADAILIIDDNRFIECNDATVAMLRYATRDELLQTHPSELSPEFQPDGRRSYEKADEMMELAFARGSHRFEWEHRRADGEVFPVEVLLTAVPWGDRRILHVVWRDITDRKRLEEELRQAQKMEAVGKLAGGIAHDFNNLLMAIGGNADLLEAEVGPAAAGAEYLQEIRRGCSRAAALVEQLLAFSRKSLRQPRVVDLNGVLGGLDRMLARLLGEDIEIVCRPDPAPLPVLVDPHQMEQVVLNLATNARDAMPGGGRLTFTTSRTQAADGGDAPGPGGPWAQLVVADTGGGIPPENLPRVFDPFFTTKEQGRGTGLGLSTVYGIVKQSGGDVTVVSEPGRGTVFRVALPLCAQALSPDEPAPAVRGAGGAETILLVEDEPTLIRLVAKVLRGRGYTVHTAGNGQEALALLEATGLAFDLLVTDVVMPRMGGPELAARLHRDRPGHRTLFMSGYTDSVLLQRGLIEGEVDLVAKPFSPAELLAKVREVLDRG